MAKVTIFIEDEPSGTIQVGADFGDVVEQNSQAHSMGMVLLESVLQNAKSYKKMEDTVPEHDVEPSVIITADKAI